VGIKDQDSFSYPIREGTGIGYSDPNTIKDAKEKISHDNFDFIEKINQFLK